MSLCAVFTPFSLERVGTGQQARQTDLILNLPVPPLTLYSYRYGICFTSFAGVGVESGSRPGKKQQLI